MKFNFKELDLIYNLIRSEADNAKSQLRWYDETDDNDTEKIEAQRRTKFAEDLLHKIENAII